MTSFPPNRSYVLTPPGAGAIGVVRVTGPDAASIVSRFFRPRGNDKKLRCASRHDTESQSAVDREPGVDKAHRLLSAPGRLRYGRFVVNGEVIDEVVVSGVETAGTPCVDICAHGGVRVMERILDALDRQGAAISDVKEFPSSFWPAPTYLDREIAETFSQAKTAQAVRFLAWQRRHLSAYLDEAARLCVSNPCGALEALGVPLGRYAAARRLMEGVTVAIVGPPNSGKSTLFNRLVGRSAAIVSPRAGTTRDWVTASVEMRGIAVTLVDTAGRHEAVGELERRAIDAGATSAENADLCVIVLDGSQPLSAADCEICLDAWSSSACLIVINKMDLGAAWEASALPEAPNGERVVAIQASALSGEGIAVLPENLLNLLGLKGWDFRAPAFFTARQKEAARRAISHLPGDPRKAEAIITEQLIGPNCVPSGAR